MTILARGAKCGHYNEGYRGDKNTYKHHQFLPSLISNKQETFLVEVCPTFCMRQISVGDLYLDKFANPAIREAFISSSLPSALTSSPPIPSSSSLQDHPQSFLPPHVRSPNCMCRALPVQLSIHLLRRSLAGTLSCGLLLPLKLS